MKSYTREIYLQGENVIILTIQKGGKLSVRKGETTIEGSSLLIQEGGAKMSMTGTDFEQQLTHTKNGKAKEIADSGTVMIQNELTKGKKRAGKMVENHKVASEKKIRRTLCHQTSMKIPQDTDSKYENFTRYR